MDHAQKWQCLSLWWWWCFTTVLGVYIIYIYYIYIHLIFGQTQMYTLEIQLTNLIISNGILKSTKLYPIYPMENPSPNPLKDVFRSAKNTSPCCHLAIGCPIIGWTFGEELSCWISRTRDVIETNPMNKNSVGSFLELSHPESSNMEVWLKMANIYIYIYILIYIYIY